MILGLRQMSESSLLFRTMAVARAQEKRVILLDFQQFEQATLLDADLFFRRFYKYGSCGCGYLNRTVADVQLSDSNARSYRLVLCEV